MSASPSAASGDETLCTGPNLPLVSPCWARTPRRDIPTVSPYDSAVCRNHLPPPDHSPAPAEVPLVPANHSPALGNHPLAPRDRFPASRNAPLVPGKRFPVPVNCPLGPENRFPAPGNDFRGLQNPGFGPITPIFVKNRENAPPDSTAEGVHLDTATERRLAVGFAPAERQRIIS